MKWLLAFFIVALALAIVHSLSIGMVHGKLGTVHRDESPIAFWGCIFMAVAALLALVCLIPKYFSA